MKLFGALAALLPMLACQSGSQFIPLPAEAESSDLIAVVIEQNGTVLGSGLVNSDRGALAPTGGREAERVWLFHYQRAELQLPAEVPLPPDEELASNRVRAAETCEAPLPSASAILLEGPAGIPPRVTTDWWNERCPARVRSDRTGVVESRCGSEQCGRETEQNGCALQIDLGGCVPGLVLTGRVHPDGAFCLEGDSVCDVVDPEPPAWGGFECDLSSSNRCPFALRDQADEPRFEIESRARIYPIEPVNRIVPADGFRFGDTVVGYVRHLAVLRDYVVAMGSGADVPWEHNVSGVRFNELLVLSRDTGQLVSTATVPDGLGFLLADPKNPNGFVGLRPLSGADRVGRFDVEGNELGAVDVAQLWPEGEKSQAFEYLPGADVFVLAGRALKDGPNTIHILNSDDLSVIDTFQVERGLLDTTGLVPLEGDRFAIANDQGNSVSLFRLGSSEFVSVQLEVVKTQVGHIAYHEPSGSIIVAATDAGVAKIRGGRFESLAGSFEALGYSTAVTPLTSNLVAVGHFEDTEAKGWLLPYDIEQGRFVPGGLRLGDGAVDSVVLADDGAIWVTLPWAAEVLRVRERPL